MDWIFQLIRDYLKPLARLTDKSTTKKRRKRLIKKKESVAALALRQELSAPRKKKILVLDLDETLVHSTSQGSRYHDKNCHLMEVLIDKHICLYYVYKRPHVDYFLQKISEWYKIVIYTASVKEYADPVIDWLDRDNRVSRRFFRDSCIRSENIYLKNIAMIEPDLSSVIIVDNSPSAFLLQPDNGILIKSWIDDDKDESLLELLLFLDALRFTLDVRSILSLARR